jgi:hypothetical protein
MENNPPAEAPVADSTESVSLPSSTPESNFGFDWASQLDNAIGQELDKESSEESKEETPSEDTAKETGEEKVTEKEETPSDETPKGLTAKAAIKWKELRSEAAEAAKLREQLTAKDQELESLKSKTSSPELEELRQKAEQLSKINSEYEAELATARVEATQEYKELVKAPLENVATYLMDLSKKYDIKDSDLFSAISEQDNTQSDKLADVASSMNERDRLKFYRAADDYAAIMERRTQFQINAKQKIADIQKRQEAETLLAKQTQQQAQEKYTSEYQAATKDVLDTMRKNIPVLADEEIATEVQKLSSVDYSNANVDLKAYLANAGAVLPHMLKAFKALEAQLEESNKTIASYRNSSAPAGGGKANDDASSYEGMGFLEALEAKIG